ncbi:MAG TPA: Tat pathway signal sequence domain protein, partial [Dongiaceae bacterium]
DGIIARRIAVEVAPLRAKKKSVKLFDVADLACPAVGSILINDVLACRGGGTDRTDCIDGLEATSRAGIELTK